MNKEIEKVKLDFDKLDKILKKQRMSRRNLESLLGRRSGWIAEQKSKDKAITIGEERFICMELGIEPGSLIRKESERAAWNTGSGDQTIKLLERILEEQKEQREIIEKLAKQTGKADARREDNSDRIEAIWNKLSNQAVQIMQIRSGIERINEAVKEMTRGNRDGE